MYPGIHNNFIIFLSIPLLYRYYPAITVSKQAVKLLQKQQLTVVCRNEWQKQRQKIIQGLVRTGTTADIQNAVCLILSYTQMSWLGVSHTEWLRGVYSTVFSMSREWSERLQRLWGRGVRSHTEIVPLQFRYTLLECISSSIRAVAIREI